MRPGELAACGCCGAQVRATWSSRTRPWADGDPVLITWSHGPHPRHHVITGETPDRCSWCWERQQAIGADAEPLYRPSATPTLFEILSADAPVEPPPRPRAITSRDQLGLFGGVP